MKYYKKAIGCKGDRIKVHFNGEGMIARNGKRIKTADGLLMNLNGHAYIVFPYGRLFKGIVLEELGKTSVRWNNYVDRWDINVASSRGNKAEIVDEILTQDEKFNITTVTKRHFLHKKAYKADAKRMLNGIKPYAMDLATVIEQNDELYTWIDNKYKEFVYSLLDDEDLKRSVIGYSRESVLKCTIRAGKSKVLECVRGMFDGDDSYAFIEDDVIKLIPAESITADVIDCGNDGCSVTLHTAKELASLMKKAKTFIRSADVIESLKTGLENKVHPYGRIHLADHDIMSGFRWARELRYWITHTSDHKMKFEISNIFDREY